MNARSHLIELNVEQRQVDEAILSLFHTLLLHRSTGKFHYKKDDTYAIGSLGIADKQCDFIDFTYVKCNSDGLDSYIKNDIYSFSQAIRSPNTPSTGQITLEFYQKKRARWPFASECTPWEVWNLRINSVAVNNENARQEWREKVGEKLGEHLLQITDLINKSDYTPAPPNLEELDLVYDTRFSDVQPFLFKIYSEAPSLNPSMSNAVKKILKDTLSLT
ncbi:UNVERIFIED_CONTAM: hypothetical protein RMT77_004188 [Armadillidium vulgare]|uniref:Autophagy-related protein 101 n=1 Tax=Armadillidium nasatum TaxID=96803 RepID=A0A5N5SHF9_9CRUS|nr:Autophagy-related protein [Armadillidium nasatum]